MKYLLILALFPLSALARAGNDGPSGSPQPLPQPPLAPRAVLAEVTTACGFMCPKGDVHGLRILMDGEVIKYSYDRETPEKDEVVATLSGAETGKLEAEAEGLVARELVDQSQGQPECMDAPTTTYLARGKDGSMIKIAQNFGCHDHVLPGGQGALIVDTLKGLSSLPR